MVDDRKDKAAGEQLVKQDVITREELEQAREQEAKSGVPWYKQLLRSGKVSFSAIDDVLRYEFHPKAVREEHQSLGEFLVETGDLEKKQLTEALNEQKRSGRLLGNILLERGFVTRDILTKALSRQHDLEFCALAGSKSSAAALEHMPRHVAEKFELIPLQIDGDRLTVLISNPQTKAKLKDLGLLLGLRIHPMLTSVDDVQAEIARRYVGVEAAHAPAPVSAKAEKKRVSLEEAESPVTVEAKAPRGKKSQEKITVAESSASKDPKAPRFDDIAKAASGASVVKIVGTILEGAANSGATDVHIDPQDPETRVRYRIDGILHDVMSIPENVFAAVISRIKIMSDLDITNTRLPQDGHISMEINGREFDVRVATLPTYLGERVVLRLLDQSSVLSGVRDLGLEEEDESRIVRIIQQPYGMILVTGPTGSGKTTTLYAMLNQKNVMTDSIVTLEDPVEYQIPGINQVQIDPDIDLTFANTLRAALRQDIDVLLVGEIRDAETARIATRAAMTGHLVFSTLHTNDAPEAISTLRNMGVPSFLISSALTSVIAQRLVRKICTNCKKSFDASPDVLRSLGLPSTQKKLFRGAGCPTCYGTGNIGRTGIFEILEISAAIRKLIAEDSPIEEIQKAAKLKTMSMRCREKVKKGIVNPEEFLRVIRT
jgi:type IV pilus assembly protein PilB